MSLDDRVNAQEEKHMTDDEIHDCFQQRSKDKTQERRLIANAIEEKLLYTKPQWQGLTFADIDDLEVSNDWLAGARWAETKLKEKNTLIANAIEEKLLYTKFEWQGLTDAEIEEFENMKLGTHDLCLEIEAKLQEKNT